jgi:hypothetical protein
MSLFTLYSEVLTLKFCTHFFVVTKNTIVFLFVLEVNIVLYTLNAYSGHGSIYENSAI